MPLKLSACSCPEFRQNLSCVHLQRLHQELTYFNTSWNPYLRQYMCLCSDYDHDSTCKHVRLLASFHQSTANCLRH